MTAPFDPDAAAVSLVTATHEAPMYVVLHVLGVRIEPVEVSGAEGQTLEDDLRFQLAAALCRAYEAGRAEEREECAEVCEERHEQAKDSWRQHTANRDEGSALLAAARCREARACVDDVRARGGAK